MEGPSALATGKLLELARATQGNRRARRPWYGHMRSPCRAIRSGGVLTGSLPG